MSFYDLATKCEEEARKDEATTMSSIAFLPTQVGAVRAALQGLGKKKGQWNLEILEGDNETTVRFEDALEIKVPQTHWEAFQGIFDGALSNNTYLELSSVGLLDSIEESEGSLLEQRLAEIHQKVEEKLNGPAIQKANAIALDWIKQFGDDHAITNESVLVSLPLFPTQEAWKDNFVNQLTEEHKEDLGQLEILLKSLQDFRTIRECSYLAGGRITCECQGIQLIFEVHTSWDDVNVFSIAVADDEVADAIEEALVGVRRIGNVFYPRGGQMDVRLKGENVINTIKETIEGTVVTGEEYEPTNS